MGLDCDTRCGHSFSLAEKKKRNLCSAGVKTITQAYKQFDEMTAAACGGGGEETRPP